MLITFVFFLFWRWVVFLFILFVRIKVHLKMCLSRLLRFQSARKSLLNEQHSYLISGISVSGIILSRLVKFIYVISLLNSDDCRHIHIAALKCWHNHNLVNLYTYGNNNNTINFQLNSWKMNIEPNYFI